MDEALAEDLAGTCIDDEQPVPEMAISEHDYADMFKDMKKKKKKSTKKASVEHEEGHAATGGPNESQELDSKSQVEQDNDCTYAKLLSRIFGILRLQNPDLAGERKKYSMIPPNIQREGSKKTMFANISELSRRMNRPMEHVVQYLFSELGTTGSTDSNERLIIKGRFQQKQIENVLKHYIMEYVTCKTCKSGNTILRKENRLSFMICESCGSTRSVSSIKTGFKAQTEKRSALRNKEG